MKILFIINQPPDLARESMIQIHNFQLISIKNTFYREREQAENSKSEKSKLVTFPTICVFNLLIQQSARCDRA